MCSWSGTRRPRPTLSPPRPRRWPRTWAPRTAPATIPKRPAPGTAVLWRARTRPTTSSGGRRRSRAWGWWTWRRKPGEAAEWFEHARNLHDLLDRARGVALMTRHLGRVAAVQGDHPRALAYFAAALAYFAAVPSEIYHHARTLTFAGHSHLATGQTAAAEQAFEKAADLAGADGHRYEHARALLGLADVAAHHGDHAAERGHLECAAEILADLSGPEEQAEIQARLDRLQQP
ncbi:tetratricopeptide repeat protein [Actinomadura yumaensis]|uniref:tetratricopeptide repeat protein n=1 Tax=Actinomadura yumaensis TaxID=111807 RepID=UPI003614991D